LTKCIVVGDGPSAAGFVPPDGVPVIAVKRAIDGLSRADYWFSLDPNAASLERMQNQRPGVVYYCACDSTDPLPEGVVRLLRVSGRKAREPRPRGTPDWWLWRWSAVSGLSDKPGRIHSGNSAWGALGLAYQLGFRDVLLVGVDGTQAERVSGGRPNNLSHLPALFRSALGQVRLHSVGHLRGIPRTTLADWLQ
jgi:hypothetical protein